jgi:hypothetical protein
MRLSIVVSPLSVHAATYYLATNGADAHSGTSAKSWATFDHAWSGMRPGDTLLVKDGIYMQSIAPTVSGTPGNPIIIKAERDGSAIIDGGGSRPALYIYNSTVVICHAGVSMLPLDHAEDSDKDKGVRDGIADCCTSTGGHRPYGDLSRPV